MVSLIHGSFFLFLLVMPNMRANKILHGRKKQIWFFFTFILVMPKYDVENKCQLPEYPQSGSKAMGIEERKKREQTSVITMVSITPGPISASWVSPKWVKRDELKKEERRKKKVSENKGQLRFYGSCLDQKSQWKQCPASIPRKPPGPILFRCNTMTTGCLQKIIQNCTCAGVFTCVIFLLCPKSETLELVFCECVWASLSIFFLVWQ